MGWIALAAAILALLAAIAFVTHGTLWRRPEDRRDRKGRR